MFRLLRRLTKRKKSGVKKLVAPKAEKRADLTLTYEERHGFASIQRWPSKEKVVDPDLITENFLHGIAPAEPFIRRTDGITAFGSCFAGHVSAHLHGLGYRVNAHNWQHSSSDLVRMNELMVHTPSLRAQFEWAFQDKPLPEVIIDGKKTDTYAYGDVAAVRKMIQSCSVYIVTLGLSEAWFDKEQGVYLWKFIPRKSLDTARFENKVITYRENVENIRAIVDIVRETSPSADIIFTLSPIPLLGTFRGMSTTVANSASKASLRAALDEVLRTTVDERVHYFPSYELINNYIRDPFGDDNRHVTKEAVSQIMSIFEKHYCVA